MEQISFGEIPTVSKLDILTREELIKRYSVLESELLRVLKENFQIRNQNINQENLSLLMNEQLEALRKKTYGSPSERYKKPIKEGPKPAPKPRIKKPSERYPNIPVREEHITMDPIPQCPCCQKTMTSSGMTEDSEQLNIIPKKYEIILQKREKYRCGCHGSIITTPAPARIIEGSSYSDEMIQDIAMSKYCDLIPANRYAGMADRQGLHGLPAHSLIELTHSFADFVSPAYSLLKKDILSSRVLHADETPHKMLEGSDKKSWYLWGFSNLDTCFLECRNTRSGDVASEMLKNSKCEVLVSDVYSGYGKAIKIVNQSRVLEKKPLIKSAYCNAHSRRYFFQAFSHYPEAQFFLDHYHEIYQLNAQSKGQSPPEILTIRQKMKTIFHQMRIYAVNEQMRYSSKSSYGKALSYFIKNFDGLLVFLEDSEVSIDNNPQERLLRSHVVGRKTWYGTHSERGAFTAAVLFSLVETCKLNHINPRAYFKKLVEALLQGKSAFTPKQFN